MRPECRILPFAFHMTCFAILHARITPLRFTLNLPLKRNRVHRALTSLLSVSEVRHGFLQPFDNVECGPQYGTLWRCRYQQFCLHSAARVRTLFSEHGIQSNLVRLLPQRVFKILASKRISALRRSKDFDNGSFGGVTDGTAYFDSTDTILTFTCSSQMHVTNSPANVCSQGHPFPGP